MGAYPKREREARGGGGRSRPRHDAIRKLTGQAARAYHSPSRDLSENTTVLLLAHGFDYDSSLMAGDYLPVFARSGDKAGVGKPFERGKPTLLFETPVSRYLDDYPHFE